MPVIGLIFLSSSISSFSLGSSAAQPQNNGCSVEIIGGPSADSDSPKMYFGQLAFLYANVTGSDDHNKTYAWTVEGPIIKGYDNITDDPSPSQLSAVRGIEDPTPMLPSDFQRQSLEFYWRNASDINRTVTVNVQTPNGGCEGSRSFIVDHSNDNINLQAEDLYVENNQTFGNRNHTSIVLKEHELWHNRSRPNNPDYNGTLFFDFHNAFLAHFDAWRDLFGYPRIQQWNPDAEIESGVEINHSNRHENGPDGSYLDLIGPMPEYFRIHDDGDGPVNRIRSTYDISDMQTNVIRPCEITSVDNSSVPQNALNDFDHNLELLGCALTAQYHNHIHGSTGQYYIVPAEAPACPGCDSFIAETPDGDVRVVLGDLSSATTAPRDPLFWRLHKFVDNVAENVSRIERAVVAPTAPEDIVPPRIDFQNPFTLNPIITGLPLISEEEKDLFGITGIPAISAQFNEPVTGVKAEDFSVNGSLATRMNGSGAGPYVFIGFETPDFGDVNVTFSPGNITDAAGNKFEGASWQYEIINENLDNDRDGLRDGVEVSEFLTDPNNTDTDGDAIPDGFEAASTTCLDPLKNDAHVMDIAGNILSEDGIDTDNDGVSNIDEFNLGTDPCLAPQAALNGELDIQGIMPFSLLEDQSALPFALVLKTTGSIAGVNNVLSYNSFTREAVLVVDGNETTRPISRAEEEVAIRTLNTSGFFDTSVSFYPPDPNSTDYTEFTVFALLGNDLNVIYWTDASDGVPESIANIPYAMTNILGTGSEFHSAE